jgi:hypothetical protein
LADGQVTLLANDVVVEPLRIHAEQPLSAGGGSQTIPRVEKNTNIPTPPAEEGLGQNIFKPRERSASLYSEWSYDYENGESDSDGEVYATPPEGLSEVEEGDEDDAEAEARSMTAPRLAQSPVAVTTTTTTSKPRDETPTLVDPRDAISRARVSHTASVPSAPVVPITPESHRPALTSQEQATTLQEDVDMCRRIIHLFLTSRMKEAENVVYTQDPDGQHMYLQNAAAVIQCIKGMMTFEAADLNTALDIAKRTSALAHSLRKTHVGLFSKMAGVVRGNTVATIAGMSLLEKHAELVFAESLLIKAVLGIVAGGDWVGLIKEA